MTSVDVATGTLLSAVYVSSAYSGMTDQELAALLEISRENNKVRGITGMLLYRGGDFMQVIEGPAANIEHLLKALAADKRHTGMTILKKSVILERQFSGWQMAFRDLNGADVKSMEGYSPFMEFSFQGNEFKEKPNLSYKLLLQFKERLW
jgi:hypothetical protein